MCAFSVIPNLPRNILKGKTESNLLLGKLDEHPIHICIADYTGGVPLASDILEKRDTTETTNIRCHLLLARLKTYVQFIATSSRTEFVQEQPHERHSASELYWAVNES